MEPIKISVIVPTFNRCQELAVTIDSVLNQNARHYEIIVLDSGPSNDGTDLLLKEYQAKYDWVHYYRCAAGLVVARNLGNLLAKGEIILQLDDDVTLFDAATLSRVQTLFRNFSIDILGAVELKTQKQVDEFRQLVLAQDFENIGKIDHVLRGIGNIDWFYNLSKGYHLLLGQPAGLYRVELLRGCFMAYRKDILKRLINWDLNYAKAGGRLSFRDETDFMLRANNAGFRAYCTNTLAFWHRNARRDRTVVDRDGGRRHYFFYASAHSYLAMKDMLENQCRHKMFRWFLHQLLWGGISNPGVLTLWAEKKFSGILFNVAGFFYGLIYALLHERRFVETPQDDLLDPAPAPNEVLLTGKRCP